MSAPIALGIAIAVPLITALAGLTQRSLVGTPLEPYAFGFFLDRFPLFTLAIVYGLARLVTVALAEPGRFRLARFVTLPLAVVALLAACLLPTFGGLVIRAGFFSGGMSYLQGQTLAGGYLLGTAMAALVYGLVLGLGVVLIRLSVTRTKRGVLRALLAYLALWWGALVIAAPRALGLDPFHGWPALPLPGRGALLMAGLSLIALAPHALVARRRGVDLPSRNLPTHREGQTIPVNRAAS